MPFIVLILLILCHLVSGYGLLTIFGIRQKAGITACLSLMLGVAIASFVPFLMQLCFVPLTSGSVFLSLGLACVLLNVPGLLAVRKKEGLSFRSFIERWARRFRKLWYKFRDYRMYPYEIPFLVILTFLIFVSVWRCYYMPPTARDALSGPETIAEYAVREHTMINSFFNIDLSTTNNQFKSPFLITLQIIYKMAGFPFGQVWLSLIFISFTVLLYQLLKDRLHPIFAGLLLMLFTMTPEAYAYTFMILYDYSNMVFLFLGLYFLFDYFKKAGAVAGQGMFPATGIDSPDSILYFAGLLMGIATYIRSETMVLVLFFIPALLFMQFREKFSYAKMAFSAGLFILPSFLGYYLTVQLYIKYYLPVHYDIGGLINPHLTLQPLLDKYGEIFNRLLVGDLSIRLWGYFMFIWAAAFLFELIRFRRLNREARNWFYAIIVVYIGLGLLGYLLPLFNVVETTKRGMFKILPLMLFSLANNEALIRLSARIKRWEHATPARQASGDKAQETAVATKTAPAVKQTPTPSSKHKKKQRK